MLSLMIMMMKVSIICQKVYALTYLVMFLMMINVKIPKKCSILTLCDKRERIVIVGTKMVSLFLRMMMMMMLMMMIIITIRRMTIGLEAIISRLMGIDVQLIDRH